MGGAGDRMGATRAFETLLGRRSDGDGDLPRTRDQPSDDLPLDQERGAGPGSRGGPLRSAAPGAHQAGPVRGDRAGTAGRVPRVDGGPAAGGDPGGGIPRRRDTPAATRSSGSTSARSGPRCRRSRWCGSRRSRVVRARWTSPTSVSRGAAATCFWSCSATRGCCGFGSTSGRTWRRSSGDLEVAFGFFGGVPGELLFDQMKSVIVRDLRSEGGRLMAAGAIRRVLQCVPLGRSSSSVRRTTSAVTLVRGRPRRGRSPSPARPPASYRSSQRLTVGNDPQFGRRVRRV